MPLLPSTATDEDVVRFFQELLIQHKTSLGIIGTSPCFLDGIRIHRKASGVSVQLSPPSHHYYIRGRGPTVSAAAEEAHLKLLKDWNLMPPTAANIAKATETATRYRSLRGLETSCEYRFRN
jgi:hypothetical protein